MGEFHPKAQTPVTVAFADRHLKGPVNHFAAAACQQGRNESQQPAAFEGSQHHSAEVLDNPKRLGG